MATAYILGAGFSRGVSEHMPLMNDLSTQIVEHLTDRQFGNVAGFEDFAHDFEAWMTYLSSDEPWLTDSENLRNRAAFYEVSSAIAITLQTAQNSVFTKPIPPWLTVLVHEWKYQYATVLTFNYDEIVERAAVTVLRTSDEPRDTRVVPLPLASPSSRRPAAGISFGEKADIVFNLLKLHGSLNWYYSGLDAPSSDPIYDAGSGDRWQAPSLGALSDHARNLLIDKVPLIVPPTSLKSSFYGNKILRAAWSVSASAVREADEIHIFGYSAPESDLLVRALLGTSFRGRRIVCVNRTDTTAKKLRALWSSSDTSPQIDTVLGFDRYVEDELPRLEVRCASESEGPHIRADLLDLARSTDGTVGNGRCQLCVERNLIQSAEGEIPGFRCPCCESRWEGTNLYTYIRGISTTAQRFDGASPFWPQ